MEVILLPTVPSVLQNPAGVVDPDPEPLPPESPPVSSSSSPPESPPLELAVTVTVIVVVWRTVWPVGPVHPSSTVFVYVPADDGAVPEILYVRLYDEAPVDTEIHDAPLVEKL